MIKFKTIPPSDFWKNCNMPLVHWNTQENVGKKFKAVVKNLCEVRKTEREVDKTEHKITKTDCAVE